jgi:hypothetical protein
MIPAFVAGRYITECGLPERVIPVPGAVAGGRPAIIRRVRCDGLRGSQPKRSGTGDSR